jgi:drug/metabolite transporter (DMT)-like permease
MPARRTWVWASLALQCVGYLFDAVWHGLLSPGVEPTTTPEMLRHLATVHLPLYIGAASVLVATFAAMLGHLRGSRVGIAAVAIAFAGALVAAAAEASHASSHLRLDTHSAPVAGVLSFVGFVVVVVSTRVSRGVRRGAEASVD